MTTDRGTFFCGRIHKLMCRDIGLYIMMKKRGIFSQSSCFFVVVFFSNLQQVLFHRTNLTTRTLQHLENLRYTHAHIHIHTHNTTYHRYTQDHKHNHTYVRLQCLSFTHTNETTHNPHLPNRMITHTRERSHTNTRVQSANNHPIPLP